MMRKSKTRTRVFLAWLIFFLSFYLFIRDPNSSETNNNKLLHNTLHQQNFFELDSIVYIAMGKMAGEMTIDYSIHSLRKLGKYIGDIYIITDSPDCFINFTNDDIHIKLIIIKPERTIIDIKALKTKILSLIPSSKKNILYLDVDIYVTKPLYSFLRDVSHTYNDYITDKLTSKIRKNTQVSSVNHSISVDMGAFYDAKGHYVGKLMYTSYTFIHIHFLAISYS